jgi:hypothetical protein
LTGTAVVPAPTPTPIPTPAPGGTTSGAGSPPALVVTIAPAPAAVSQPLSVTRQKGSQTQKTVANIVRKGAKILGKGRLTVKLGKAPSDVRKAKLLRKLSLRK